MRVHLVQHEVVLLHVEPAHVLGQPGGRRLHAHELVGRLRAVAQRQLGLRCTGRPPSCTISSSSWMGISRRTSRARCGMAHVALDQAAVGPADLGQDFAGGEVDDLVDSRGSCTARPSGYTGICAQSWSLSSKAMDALAGFSREIGQSDKPVSEQPDSVHPHRRRRRELAERPDAADAVPRVFVVRLLALAFVAFQEARDEELLGQRRQHHAARSGRSPRPCRGSSKSTTSMTARGCGA